MGLEFKNYSYNPCFLKKVSITVIDKAIVTNRLPNIIVIENFLFKLYRNHNCNRIFIFGNNPNRDFFIPIRYVT